MKKQLLLIMLLLFIPFCFAEVSDVESNVVMGEALQDAIQDDVTAPMSEQVLALQEQSGTAIVQVATYDVLVEQQKIWIQNRISAMWMLILGLFRLMIEIIQQAFYIFILWIYIVFMFKVLPAQLLKIKEGITKWVTGKYN